MRLLLPLLAVFFVFCERSFANVGAPYTPSLVIRRAIVANDVPNPALRNSLRRDQMQNSLLVIRDRVRNFLGKDRGRRRDTIRSDELNACEAFYGNYSSILQRNAVFAQVAAEAARDINLNVAKERDMSSAISQVDTSAIWEECPFVKRHTCVALKYRTSDGLCNNVLEPWQGSTGEPLRRLLPAAYQDRYLQPRSRTVNGRPLPRVRDVVAKVHREVNDNDERQEELSLFFPVWGQFVLLDTTQTTQTRLPSGECVDCCAPGASSHPDCQADITECSGFVRLLPGLSGDCRLRPRSPANLATSYLDGSAIYGSTEADVNRLRSFVDGKLRVDRGGQLAPPAPFDSRRCNSDNPAQACFDFGNYNMNMDEASITLGIIFLRQHNLVADQLASLNRHWDDERLFHETRRIIAAQVQHITFNEFLPILLGRERMSSFDLSMPNAGYYNGYNANVSAQTLLAFPTAAAFILSMQVPSEQPPYSPKRFYFDRFVDRTVHAALDAQPLKLDHRAVDITFPGSRLSLVGEVIQAGRDTGLPPYTAFRRACRLPPIRAFRDLAGVVNDDALASFNELYETVDDIDLFSGGLAEISVDGGLLGPTFACILAESFQAMRRGDRFWYENFVYPSAFPEEQLNELRKTTLARIICETTNVGKVQRKALEAADVFENFPVDCDNNILPTLDWTQFTDPTPKIGSSIPRALVSRALALGTDVANARFNRESKLRSPLSIVSRSSVLHFLVLRPTEHAQSICRIAEILLETTKVFMNRQQELLGISPQQMPPREVLSLVLPTMDVHDVAKDLPDDECVMHLSPCDHSSPYRTLTGWCNNIEHPEFGSAYNTYRRLLPAAYEDGINEPRQRSVSGRQLPSARKVSTSMDRPTPPSHQRYTHLVMQWGQFLDHDITLSPISHSETGGPLNCKSCDSRATVSANCFPIEIPPGDPHFPPVTTNGSRACLPFTRSVPGQLTLGARQQINTLSGFIDGSNIYGSDICRSKKVRAFRKGLLDVQRTPGGDVMPANPDQHCNGIDPVRMQCFFAGDERSNEQVALSAMHIVWVREHNQIAERLAVLNPSWNDERLFQETRRIVGAILQRITYNEFLPKVIGYKIMNKYDMTLLEQGFYDKYDDKCDATVANEFSAAAYRFGHTLIAPQYKNKDDNVMKFPFDIFFNPTKLYQANGISDILNGMSEQPCMRFDSHFAKGIRDHMFERREDPHSGLDLPALNIQRARDHGLNAYVHYRRLFGLSVPRGFEDLNQIMQREPVEAFKNVYESVEDIDLFPGLMSEKPEPGMLVGPLTAHILAEQFSRFRNCDRFWHENSGQTGSFTAAQLAEIRKVTLAKVLCRQVPSMSRVQPEVFIMPDDNLNSHMNCDDIKEMDLEPWRETSTCRVLGASIELRGTKLVSPCLSCTCTSDGPVCSSTRVRNCIDLNKTFSLAQIEADVGCVVQCHAMLTGRSRS